MDEFLQGFAFLSISTLVIFTFVQVVGRYFFSRSWGWIEEVSVVILCYTAWVTACLLIKDNRHLKVTVLIQKFPTRYRHRLHLIMTAFIFVFLIIVVYASKGTIESMEGITFMSFDLPLNIKFYSVPIGAGLLAYYQIRDLWENCREMRDGNF